MGCDTQHGESIEPFEVLHYSRMYTYAIKPLFVVGVDGRQRKSKLDRKRGPLSRHPLLTEHKTPIFYSTHFFHALHQNREAGRKVLVCPLSTVFHDVIKYTNSIPPAGQNERSLQKCEFVGGGQGSGGEWEGEENNTIPGFLASTAPILSDIRCYEISQDGVVFKIRLQTCTA